MLYFIVWEMIPLCAVLCKPVLNFSSVLDIMYSRIVPRQILYKAAQQGYYTLGSGPKALSSIAAATVKFFPFGTFCIHRLNNTQTGDGLFCIRLVVRVFSAQVAGRGVGCAHIPFQSFYLLHSSYPAHSTPSPTKIARDSYLSSPISPLLFVSKSIRTLSVSLQLKVAAAFCKLHIFLYALCIALSPHSAGNSLKAFISYCLLINSRTSNISVYRGKNRNCPEEYFTVESQKPNS